MLAKPKRVKDRSYLNWIKERRCVVWHRHACLGPIDPSHLISRGAGGSDYAVTAKCRKAHTEFGTIGMKAFEEKYEVNLWFEAWLSLQTWMQTNGLIAIVILFLGACGRAEPIILTLPGATENVSQELANTAAARAEDYFTQYGIEKGWAGHSTIYNAGPEKTREACQQLVAGCTVSAYAMVINNEANAFETVAHEFGHIAAARFFGTWDESHTVFSDYFNDFIFGR